MAVEYRKLIESDLDIFIEMRMMQLQEEGAEASFDLKPYLQDYYKRHRKDNTFVSWLAIDGNRIVGTSGMSFVEKPPYYSCPSGKIGLLSIAKFLLDKVVKEAKDFGCAAVQITASDMGVLLYTDYGFKKNDNFMYYSL